MRLIVCKYANCLQYQSSKEDWCKTLVHSKQLAFLGETHKSELQAILMKFESNTQRLFQINGGKGQK